VSPSCPAPVHAEALAAHLAAVERAWVAMDAAATSQAGDRLQADLPCVVDRLDLDEVAAVHRGLALVSFARGRLADAEADAAAAWATLPAYRLPSTLVPDGHPFRALYDGAAGRGDGGVVPLPSPAPDRWVVDGRDASVAPRDRPWIVQRVAPGGQVAATARLAPGGLPEVPVAPLPPPPARVPASRGWWAGAATATVFSGASFAVARYTRDRFRDPDFRTGDPLPDLIAVNRVAGATGIALGAAALGCGVAAVVTTPW
jgi:hypothetical protein